MKRTKKLEQTGAQNKNKIVTASCRLAQGLMWPLFFAGKLAFERRSKQIELCDFLGGLFVGEFEKLSHYYQDWQKLEEVLRRDCGVIKPIWFYRIELYHELQRKRHPSRNKLFPFSHEVAELLQAASNIGDDAHTTRGSLEDVLLAISMRTDSATCQNFTDAGLILRPADSQGPSPPGSVRP